jgi:hypothetical protein
VRRAGCTSKLCYDLGGVVIKGTAPAIDGVRAEEFFAPQNIGRIVTAAQARAATAGR